MFRPESVDGSTFVPDVDGSDIEGKVLSWRWLHAPSSSGTGRSEGKLVSEGFSGEFVG